MGYHVYEATETAVLSAEIPGTISSLPGPDTANPFTDRLATLRGRPLQLLRQTFRRITEHPLTDAHYEVSLPRGSRVIHLFTVLAENANGVVSDWPTDSGRFVAVAASRQIVPQPPVLSVTRLAGPQPKAEVKVTLAAGETGDAEVFRTPSKSAAAEIDSMGPRLRKLPSEGGVATFLDETLVPAWTPYYYRALVWSKPEGNRGVIEARSMSSPVVSLFLPPAEVGSPTGLTGNIEFTTPTAALIAWQSDVPTIETLLGPFKFVVEVRDTAGGSVRRRHEAIASALRPINEVAHVPDPADSNAPQIFRLGWMAPDRFYAWSPRAADQAVDVTVKIIDPRGPLKSANIVVPPLAPDAQFVEIPPWGTEEEVENGDDMGVLYQGAEALGLQLIRYYEQGQPGYFHTQVISISPPAGTRVPVGSTVLVVINLEH